MPAKKLRVGQDQRASLPIDLGDATFALLVESPRAREAEPFHVKAERRLHVSYV